MLKLTTHSDVDQLQAYLMGKPVQLSPKLEEMLKRFQEAADLMRKHGSRMVVAKKMQALYGYKQASAYRDIDDAVEVFTPQRPNQQAFYVDVVLGKIFVTHEKAIAAGDLKTAAACEKNMLTTIEKFFGGSQAFPLDKVNPQPRVIGFFPELTGMKLPDDWREQVKRLSQAKRTIDITPSELLPAEEMTAL